MRAGETDEVSNSSYGSIIFINICGRDCAHFARNQFVREALSQQMVNEAFDFSARVWQPAQARAFLDGAINQLFFGRLFKDESEGFVSRRAVNLFELQVALETLATHRLLPHAIRSITEGETLVVQVAVLAKFRQHRFNYLSIRPLFFQQALAQFRD